MSGFQLRKVAAATECCDEGSVELLVPKESRVPSRVSMVDLNKCGLLPGGGKHHRNNSCNLCRQIDDQQQRCTSEIVVASSQEKIEVARNHVDDVFRKQWLKNNQPKKLESSKKAMAQIYCVNGTNLNYQTFRPRDGPNLQCQQNLAEMQPQESVSSVHSSFLDSSSSCESESESESGCPQQQTSEQLAVATASQEKIQEIINTSTDTIEDVFRKKYQKYNQQQ